MPKDTIECMVLRDIWDEKCCRHRAGTLMLLSAEIAMDLIEIGAVSRLKKKR